MVLPDGPKPAAEDHHICSGSAVKRKVLESYIRT
ncbi:hypothetical protein ACP70R_044774 [Stipagrostis hirtigluma subsp. patula]